VVVTLADLGTLVVELVDLIVELVELVVEVVVLVVRSTTGLAGVIEFAGVTAALARTC
jgi:hypothetical protein